MMYARLRGVPEEALIAIVERTLNELSLLANGNADHHSSKLRYTTFFISVHHFLVALCFGAKVFVNSSLIRRILPKCLCLYLRSC